MVEKKLYINVIDDLPLLNFDSDDLPDIIIFGSSVKIPLIEPNNIISNITVDPKLEYLSYMPYGYRKNYLHPGLFHLDLVKPEIREKLRALNEWLHQKNNKLYFCVTPEIPDSVDNACSYLGDLFQDCKNPDDSSCCDITTIPYPLKISTYSEDHPRSWIWSCYWPSDLGTRIMHDNLPDEAKLLNFHGYSDMYFPVSSKETEDGGVIVFSVSVGDKGGKVFVVPQYLIENYLPNTDDDVTLYIEDIPEVLKGLREQKYVKIKLKYKDCNIAFEEVNLYLFIRFMYIYYCTQKENSFQYKVNDRKFEEVNFAEKGRAQWHKRLLNSEKDAPDINFSKTLKDIIRRCIIPLAMTDEYAKIIENLVVHKKTETETGFIDLQLSNLNIIFSQEAWSKMEKMGENGLKSTHPIINDLKGRWSGFFNMVTSVATCE